MIMSRTVIAIDVSSKPNDIPNSEWLIQGNEYTVLKIVNSKLTKDKFFVLNEIQISNKLYGGYNISRFGIPVEDLEEWIEVNNIQIEELV